MSSKFINDKVNKRTCMLNKVLTPHLLRSYNRYAILEKIPQCVLKEKKVTEKTLILFTRTQSHVHAYECLWTFSHIWWNIDRPRSSAPLRVFSRKRNELRRRFYAYAVIIMGNSQKICISLTGIAIFFLQSPISHKSFRIYKSTNLSFWTFLAKICGSDLISRKRLQKLVEIVTLRSLIGVRSEWQLQQ